MNKTRALTHVISLCGALTAVLIVYAVLHSTGIYSFTSRETEGLNTLILLLGSIYAVMFAFVIFVIWGQFTEVEALSVRESSALNELLRFGAFMNPDAQHALRRTVTEYSKLVSQAEWSALGNGQKSVEAERAFNTLLKAVVQMSPSTSLEDTMHKRLIEISSDASECRDERIAKSLTRIPPTLLLLVRGMASAIFLLVLLYPFHHGIIGGGCLAVVGAVLFFADVVMRDTDNPFDGLCNITPRAFEELTSA